MGNLEVLASVMYQDSFEIGYHMKIHSDLLIINQCDIDDYQEIEVDGFKWRMLSTRERGLSNSRNMALENSSGEILLFADNDEVFSDGYAGQILRAFEQCPDATMIAFNVCRVNVSMQKKYYRIKEFKESNRSFGSPMTAVRRKSVMDKGIRFDPHFGSGTPWGGGEDGLFQRAIREQGYKIYEHPYEVATIDYSNASQWFHGYTQEYFYQQGAFAEYSGEPKLKRLLYALYLSFIKLRKEKKLSPIQKIVWRMKGEKGWRENVTYSQYVENGYRYKKRK